jgi:hypothetical protein
MKKLLILFLLFVQLNISLSATDYTENENITLNIGISLFYPIEEDWPVAGNILGSIIFSSLYFGAGYHLSLLPNILMPGIYGEVNFWLLPLLIQYLLDSDLEIESSDILDIGIRLYNQFRFGLFDFQPFIGFNLSVLRGFSMIYGFLLAYNNFGIEYSFLELYPDQVYTDSRTMHRIAFVYHFH